VGEPTGCGYRLEHPKEKCFKGRRWRWSPPPKSPYEDIIGNKYEWRDVGKCPKCKGNWTAPPPAES